MQDATKTMPDHIGLAVDIVSAFVSNNSVPVTELPALITSVHTALGRLSSAGVEETIDTPTPAVSVKRSITPDFIVCLEDGKKFKSLKRHLRTRYGLTPEAYRAKWSLPGDYPMVAPNYAAARSELARNMGLGQQRRKPRPAPDPSEPRAAPARRGRPPKAAAAAQA